MKRVQSTRSGAAAIYIVIIMTILVSVITVSFIRVMTSNVQNTVNSDLSISAYDSALAGIEDAKAVLVRYKQCLDEGKTAQEGSSDACESFLHTVQTGIKNDSCDTVADALGRTIDLNDGSVKIQETTNADEASVELLQAYTCVKITENVTDYRGTLDRDNRTTIVPLRTYRENYKDVRALKIMWHSQKLAEGTETMSAIGTALPPRGIDKVPALTVDIFQTSSSFTIGELSVRKGDQTDFAELFLRPSKVENSDTHITNKISAADVVALADMQDNSPIDITCSKTAYYCTAIIDLPAPIGGGSYPVDNREPSTFFLRLGLPYADAFGTDFSVTMCKKERCEGTGTDGLRADALETTLDENLVAYFVGVQANVDSTGRANDVYRRVDARIDLVSTNFPYPEYAIWMAGTGDTDVDKDFWVTSNCRKKTNSDSELKDCKNDTNYR